MRRSCSKTGKTTIKS